jgi:hypothetical protein
MISRSVQLGVCLRWTNAFPFLVIILAALGKPCPLLGITFNVAAAQDLSDSSTSLWEPAQNYQVVGPSVFPKPTRLISNYAVPILKPTFGQHRPEKDAVFAYAEGQCENLVKSR